MIDHDRLFKELLTTFFAEFVELFIPELYDCLDASSMVFLDKEVFTDVTAGDAHEADLVVRVKLKGRESFILVHAETQSRAQKSFPRRMFQYFARLHERHDLPVYPVVVYSFNRPRDQQPSVYNLQLPGLDVLSFRYRVIQLNRLPWKDYLKRQNPISAALMAKMQFGEDERFRVNWSA
jgi:Putative transposase, YhgA-like.